VPPEDFFGENPYYVYPLFAQGLDRAAHRLAALGRVCNLLAVPPKAGHKEAAIH
jgi:hypothetical protein